MISAMHLPLVVESASVTTILLLEGEDIDEL